MRRHHLLCLTAALFALAPARAEPPKAGGADLVPSTAFGFVTVRVSDFRDVEALKPVREAIARFEKGGDGLPQEIGLGFDELDRITLFWPALPGDHTDQVPVVVVTTRAPFNEAKLLKALKAVP